MKTRKIPAWARGLRRVFTILLPFIAGAGGWLLVWLLSLLFTFDYEVGKAVGIVGAALLAPLGWSVHRLHENTQEQMILTLAASLAVDKES